MSQAKFHSLFFGLFLLLNRQFPAVIFSPPKKFNKMLALGSLKKIPPFQKNVNLEKDPLLK